MADYMTEKMIMEEIEIKEEKVIIKEDICSSSSLQETCTWDVKEEDVKIENTEMKGKVKDLSNICSAPLF